MASREIRRIINTKQDSLESTGNLSINSMADGQVSIGKSTSELLSIRKKKYGRVYKSYMSSNGNQVVDKNLTVGGNLNVKGHVVGSQYMMFCHNFADDIGTTEHTIPWSDVNENTGISGGVVTGFLTPYKMTLKKIQFRIETISQQGDIFFKIKKIDDGDTVQDEIASAEFDSTITAKTIHELNRSDFNNIPVVPANSMAIVTITADTDIDQGGIASAFFITSVWEVEIVL
jgi:hypothetical protein|tara:strand:+ start:269 stop:961 length:693 start_codon:yes stop_codon:yes gene_type:complete